MFSIFSSLVGFRSGPTYILYQYILSFRGAHYIISFSLQEAAGWCFRLWRLNMTFLGTEMMELDRKHPTNIHNTRSLIRTLKYVKI